MADNKILILGSGIVADPCVDTEPPSRDSPDRSGLWTQTVEPSPPLRHQLQGYRERQRSPWIFARLATSTLQIASYDLLISLVPFVYHASITKLAIKHKVNVVTTSYISNCIRELDDPAKEAGIVVLNEAGVDPGVDHLYATKKIDEVHAKGGLVKEFYSYCGGLPAREHADNPLGFKFYWFPRGALFSQYNSAQFLSRGEKIEISKKDRMGVAEPYFVLDGWKFPTPSSVDHSGTRGNPSFVKALIDLGWLDTQPKDWLKEGTTGAETLQKATAAGDPSGSTFVSRIAELCRFPTDTERDRILTGLRWIGLFSSAPATVHGGNLLDTLCAQLEQKLNYRPGERGLVVLQHKFVVLSGKMARRKLLHQRSNCTGRVEGTLSWRRPVGVTCGVAAQLLLDGQPALSACGVLAPYGKGVFDAMRELVEKEGIGMVERVV
ncbi:MAG: hypothetical protein Q9219_003550 [cf. Caloplaca sp. 3 TL-2023]